MTLPPLMTETGEREEGNLNREKAVSRTETY